MPKQCKFLSMRYSNWENYERELNKWINQGYEVKQIISLSSVESYWNTTRQAYATYTEEEGFAFYLEREVSQMPPTTTYNVDSKYDRQPRQDWVEKPPVPKAQTNNYVSEDKDLPF